MAASATQEMTHAPYMPCIPPAGAKSKVPRIREAAPMNVTRISNPVARTPR